MGTESAILFALGGMAIIIFAVLPRSIRRPHATREADVATLVRILERDGFLDDSVVRQLAEMGGRTAAIRTLLARPGDDTETRCHVARMLAPFPEEAVKILVDGLRGPDPNVRLAAAEILGQVPVEGAIPALLVAVARDIGPVRMHAALSLARCGLTADVLPTLIAGLRGSDHLVRAEAAWCLQQLGAAPEITAAVEAVLHDSDPFVRAGAALALQEVRAPEPVHA